MTNLPQPIEYSNQRILTSAQLAELYGTEVQIITNNFNRNKSRYTERKHYFALGGEAKRDFLTKHQIDFNKKNQHLFYLWTEKGALHHAKSLGTDAAWEMYERLVDEYYRLKSESQNEQGKFPNTLFMQRSLLFSEKTNIPAWMFCIFEEITTTFHFAELRNCKLPEGAVPDGSVGRKWCENVRSKPETYDISLMERYPHSYPDKRKDQWAFIYPVAWLGDFRIWFKQVYIPLHLPSYLEYLKVPQEEIQQIMKGFGVSYQIKAKRGK